MTLIRQNPRLRTVRPMGAWDPWDNFFDRMLTPWHGAGVTRSRPEADEAALSPAVDVIQREGEILVKAELPGVRKEDIEITVHDGTLTIKGEKKSEHEETEEGYRYAETRYGEFTRSFELPEKVDETGVKAEFTDGVLRIHLPLVEEVKPRKIDVSVN